MIIGTPIDEVSMKLEYEVKPIIARYVKQHEVLYNAFYSAFSDFTNNSNKKHFNATRIQRYRKNKTNH